MSAQSSLAGRTVVVTGASRGIGLAIVVALVDAGAHVVAGARTVTAELQAMIDGGSVRAVGVDLATPDGPNRLIDSIAVPVDVLVNNVGSAPARTGGFLSVTDDDWATTFGLNLMPAVRTTRAVLPGMLAAGSGSIVTVCSANARLPDPMVIDYGAAKAALLNFSKGLSKEVGPSGIRVNTVSPGPVETSLWLGEHGVAATLAAASGAEAGSIVEQAAHQSVTGRFTHPHEVAAAVVFLAGDTAANITGTDLAIDGGLVPTI